MIGLSANFEFNFHELNSYLIIMNLIFKIDKFHFYAKSRPNFMWSNGNVLQEIQETQDIWFQQHSSSYQRGAARVSFRDTKQSIIFRG